MNEIRLVTTIENLGRKSDGSKDRIKALIYANGDVTLVKDTHFTINGKVLMTLTKEDLKAIGNERKQE